ncbi:hypothetical protein ACJRO7_035253 [Eucalyptus globulus]|uniref:Mitochondrial inner membrane protease ATP23 n=1 Tax=Eucalyptus globulus TaxID=34317 RepID=A0ABD3JAG7_EUCGL
MAEEPPPAGSSSSAAAADGGRAVKECEKMIQRSLRTPMVRFLKEQLEKAGCSLGDNFIKAVNCDGQVSGGYMPGLGIVVCSNHMELQDDVNQVVIHELIHAYDECRAANLDWSNCAHHACSEECVRRRVMKSVTANPHCSEAAAKDAMEAVWDVCYNDTKPFDRAP